MREASRTLRRYPGGAVVSVTLRGRSYGEVVDDMIDGVLAANRVGPDSVPRLRRAFQLALGDELPEPRSTSLRWSRRRKRKSNRRRLP